MHRRMHLICGLCCCTQFVGHVFAFCAYPAICKCDVIYVWKCLWQQKWKWFIQLSSVNLLLAFTKISHATHRLNGGVNTRIKLHQIECINLFAVFCVWFSCCIFILSLMFHANLNSNQMILMLFYFHNNNYSSGSAQCMWFNVISSWTTSTLSYLISLIFFCLCVITLMS